MKDQARHDDSAKAGVLRGAAVRVLEHPALVECGNDKDSANRAITVVPLLDGQRVAGFEVRCACGSSAIVECVYTNEAQK